MPGEDAIAHVVRDLALELIEPHEKIHELDKLIEIRFHQHELAPVITSLPGIGPLLGAGFLAATALDRFPSADRLAAFAGAAPVPRDSGNVNGNLHRPHPYHRGLQRVFYRSAMISIRSCPECRIFYNRRRAEKKTHKHALPMQLSRCSLSLHPRSGEQVPPLTSQVARASKPDGTTAM